MNYIVGGYYIYDSLKQIAFSVLPQSATIFWGCSAITRFTPEQEAILAKINELKTALCQQAGIDPADVKIEVAVDQHQFCSLGNASNAVIRISSSIVTTLASAPENHKYFRLAYRSIINKVPNDPLEMLKYIQCMSDQELHEFLGLHERCRNDLKIESFVTPWDMKSMVIQKAMIIALRLFSI
jgi:hypothetical protein